MPELHPTLSARLVRAYEPCPAFRGACQTMRWDPTRGHVPRGFCGATGGLDEVELVLVGAEPGDPHVFESHGRSGAGAQLQSAYHYAYECFHSGRDLYHRNMRKVMELCWPDASFDEHMRRVWITDSVMCSARIEAGRVPSKAAKECRRLYLDAQLDLFPNATIAALGNKPWQRLAGRTGVIKAFSVAPPGYNMHKEEALKSWAAVARAVRERALSRAQARDVSAG